MPDIDAAWLNRHCRQVNRHWWYHASGLEIRLIEDAEQPPVFQYPRVTVRIVNRFENADDTESVTVLHNPTLRRLQHLIDALTPEENEHA